MIAIQINPRFESLIPPITDAERSALETSLIAEGCRDALVLWNDTLIDGHNRLAICTQHGLPYTTVQREFASEDAAAIWIIQNQLARRNLSAYDRSRLALQLEPLLAAEGKARQAAAGQAAVARKGESGKFEESNQLVENSPQAGSKETPPKTRKVIADIAGVSDNTIAKVKVIEAKAPPEVKAALRRGEVSINEAHKQVKTEQRRTERIEKIAEISQGNTELNLNARYPVLYADPPWKYDYAETESRAIENQYPTMEIDDICALPVVDLATPDAVLFLWATSPKLVEALRVIDAWGFTYRTCAVWDKQKIGMGYYFRQQHELLLVATRGNIPAPLPEARPPSVFSEPRGEHSAKPIQFSAWIEAMYPELPRIELFCRSPREGWAVWGNQSC